MQLLPCRREQSRGKAKSISRLSWGICFLLGVCVYVCEGRDRSSGWSKRLWLQRGISLKTCWIYHCPGQPWQTHTQTQIQTHMNTHVFGFMGPELRSPHHIVSYSSRNFTHHLFLYCLLFRLVALELSYIFFFLTPIQTLSLSPTLLGFLSAGLLSDRKGFVRCQIPELRDQRQTKRRVTYCSILERQKMESLIDQDIAFFPFSPLAALSLIQSSFLALVFFSLLSVFPPPHPNPCCL